MCEAVQQSVDQLVSMDHAVQDVVSSYACTILPAPHTASQTVAVGAVAAAAAAVAPGPVRTLILGSDGTVVSDTGYGSAGTPLEVGLAWAQEQQQLLVASSDVRQDLTAQPESPAASSWAAPASFNMPSDRC